MVTHHANRHRALSLFDSDGFPLLLIAATFIAAWFAIGGHRNTSLIDDWLYAASVQDLLSTGHFRIGPISAVYPVLPILWGGLLCRVFGFSFGVLRASTMSVAAVGCMGLYLLLRETGRSRLVSVIAALTMALSPTFFLLSASFMTDVPFVALTTLSLYGYVSGLQRGSSVRWALGGLGSVAAFLVRPLAVALPLAAAVGLWRTRRLTARWLAAPLIAMIAIVGLQISMPALFGPLDVGRFRATNIHYVLMVTAREYASWDLHLLYEAAFPIAPLIAAACSSRQIAVRVGVVSVVVGVLLWWTLGSLPTPLPDNQTWSMRDLAARTLVPCPDIGRALWAVRAAPFVAVAGLVVFSGVLCGVAMSVEAGSARSGAGAIIAGFGVLQLLLATVLWLYNDRYYIVFLPTLAYFATALVPKRAWLGLPVLALWALVSITGVRDTLAFNDAVNAAVQRLESAGIPPADIDGGWTSNGWRLYAHPENLPPGANRADDVPFVTSSVPARYRIANCPQPGYVVIDTIPLPAATWQATRRIYVTRAERKK